jgi:hypothetical protein
MAAMVAGSALADMIGFEKDGTRRNVQGSSVERSGSENSDLVL